MSIKGFKTGEFCPTCVRPYSGMYGVDLMPIAEVPETKRNERNKSLAPQAPSHVRHCRLMFDKSLTPQAQPDEQDWNKAFQAQVVIGAQLEKQIADMKEMHDFGWQCYQDRCEGAYIEASVVKRLEAQLAECRRERDEAKEQHLLCGSMVNEWRTKFHAIRAERDRYRAALKRILNCVKGKWYDVTDIASKALGLKDDV